MRWLAPLLLLGCASIDQEDWLDRIDRDEDGLWFPADCIDVDPDATTFDQLVSVDEPVGCPTELTCGMDVECIPAGSPFYAAEGTWVLGCTNPYSPQQLAAVPADWQVVRLAPDVVGTVAIEAQIDIDVEQDGDVILGANQGSTCSLDTCKLGFPVRAQVQDAHADAGVDSTTFPTHAQLRLEANGSTPWYVVLGGDETFRLSVSCTP